MLIQRLKLQEDNIRFISFTIKSRINQINDEYKSKFYKSIIKMSATLYRFIGILFFTLANQFLYAQTLSPLRISIITCGVGEDLYSCYGHSAVRIIDSVNESDIVYNYGTFNFNDPDFYLKFTRGKLPYYLNDEEFNGFMRTYLSEGRSVYEQVLALSTSDAKLMQQFLINNLKEENKYYRYDFLLDNCSTRIRDIFSSQFKTRFQYGHSMADDSCSFRTILDFYEKEKHWERLGVNLLMSNIVDNKMTNLESMFLPDYLMKGLADATLDGQRIVQETIQLLPQEVSIPKTLNQPKVIFWGLLILIYFLSKYKQMQAPLLYFDVFFFMILGLLGCFMLFMWFGTAHQVCSNNRNLLWAFPLHAVFAFLIPRKSDKLAKYAKYSIYLIILSMLYGFFAYQKYMPEITPILLLMLLRFSNYTVSRSYFKFNPQS